MTCDPTTTSRLRDEIHEAEQKATHLRSINSLRTAAYFEGSANAMRHVLEELGEDV